MDHGLTGHLMFRQTTQEPIEGSTGYGEDEGSGQGQEEEVERWCIRSGGVTVVENGYCGGRAVGLWSQSSVASLRTISRHIVALLSNQNLPNIACGSGKHHCFDKMRSASTAKLLL